MRAPYPLHSLNGQPIIVGATERAFNLVGTIVDEGMYQSSYLSAWVQLPGIELPILYGWHVLSLPAPAWIESDREMAAAMGIALELTS